MRPRGDHVQKLWQKHPTLKPNTCCNPLLDCDDPNSCVYSDTCAGSEEGPIGSLADGEIRGSAGNCFMKRYCMEPSKTNAAAASVRASDAKTASNISSS